MRTIRALACDYDRTLTTPDLALEPATLRALDDARAAGLLVLVVSGRDAAFLLDHVGAHADLLVAENGAFLVEPRTGRAEPLFTHWPGRDALARAFPDLEHGEASASAEIARAEALAAAVARAGLAVRLEANRDRMMVLPEGVEKASGFAAALARAGVAASEAAAIGDGENDVSLLAASGWPIAVANAIPEVKRIARHVTREPGGRGVAEWIREVWIPSRVARSVQEA